MVFFRVAVLHRFYCRLVWEANKEVADQTAEGDLKKTDFLVTLLIYESYFITGCLQLLRVLPLK